MQVRFPAFGRQPQSLFQLLSRNASLQDPVKLFGIHVQWSFFTASRGSFRRGLMLLVLLRWRLHLGRYGVARRLMVHHHSLRSLRMWAADMVQVTLVHSWILVNLYL